MEKKMVKNLQNALLKMAKAGLKVAENDVPEEIICECLQEFNKEIRVVSKVGIICWSRDCNECGTQHRWSFRDNCSIKRSATPFAKQSEIQAIRSEADKIKLGQDIINKMEKEVIAWGNRNILEDVARGRPMTNQEKQEWLEKEYTANERTDDTLAFLILNKYNYPMEAIDTVLQKLVLNRRGLGLHPMGVAIDSLEELGVDPDPGLRDLVR